MRIALWLLLVASPVLAQKRAISFDDYIAPLERYLHDRVQP